ncbi:hypothetical protein AB0L53_56495 [Nonomuraea sp. NPDC052129]
MSSSEIYALTVIVTAVVGTLATVAMVLIYDPLVNGLRWLRRRITGRT